MFSVLFEVHPNPARWDTYLETAGMLRPELEQVDGFVDNVRYRSLTRQGWLLSLSGWRDEKALVRWRTQMRHHMAQERGRSQILLDYHLRVGQVTRDTELPAGHVLQEQRLDVTEVGKGVAVVMVTATRPADWMASNRPEDVAAWLGSDPSQAGCAEWDVFDAVLTPGDLILLATWRNDQAAAEFGQRAALPAGARVRQVRVIRDYGMFDRREAPQFYAEATRTQQAPS
jgi:heme-degrading monooxygenase HmoA